MREIKDATPALGIALLVHAQDDLAVEPAQQLLEFGSNHVDVGAILFLAEARAEHLVAFLARKLVEELVEAKHLIRFAEHQINRYVGAQALVDLVQTLTALARQRFELQFARVQQLLDRDVD